MKESIRSAAALIALSAVSPLTAAKLPDSPDIVPYTYTVDRRDVEKKPGSICDGDTSTGLRWHTKFAAKTDIVCELSEGRAVDKVEIHLPKYTKWYIVKELRVAVDNGFGGFADPVVLPGLVPSPKGGAIRDNTCTNHVFSVTGLGKVVRLKVSLTSDAAAAVNEIRIFGKPKPSPVAAVRENAPVPRADVEKKIASLKKLENRNWALAFNPLGGRVMSLYSKAIGAELTSPVTHGSFVEEVWDRRKSHDFLIRQPYAMTYETGKDGAFTTTAIGNAQGGGIDFLKVVKRYCASDDSTALKVDYRFENIPEAMALQNYAPLVHATLGVFGKDVTCYYPTTEGIVAVHPGKRGNEYWGHRPARGWMAAATTDGIGVAVTMPFAEVKTFYSWFSQVPTLEWRMIPVGLEAGAWYDISTEIIPFSGLKTVSGAGGGLVGSLSEGVCTVVSARADEVTAEADGKIEKLSFASPGATASFRTKATSVVLKRGGREVCRLEALPAQGAWTLAKECVQRGSSVAEVDLACYTNFPRTVCNPWAKPLPGRRLKVSVITGNGNQIEVGRLAERFDIDFRTIGVSLAAGYPKKRALGNPIFSDGDNFSLINTADLERGIMTVLKYESDVILVGGVPFEVLTKDLRDQLIARVKGGTALVWIGLDHDVPELGFKLKKAKLSRGTPVAKSADFESVAFPLLGGEDVYALEASKDAIVHAECGDRPYIVESKLGKGRMFFLAYRALTNRPWPAPGLTPADLRDFYETKEAPVEEYYSLIAKTLLAAAGRTLPVSFDKAEVSASRAVFDVKSRFPGKTCWDWSVTDSFNREIAAGRSEKELAAGAQTVVVDSLAVPPVQGPLLFRLSVRTRQGGVLNWGSWAFVHEPKASIASFKTDKRWLREGESVAFTAEIAGETDGTKLEVSLVDSYARTMAKTLADSGSTVKGSFRIENALPARSYTIDAKLIGTDGKMLGRRRVELRVRPDEKKYAWTDFEVGTWASANNREYLWPGLADIYRRIGISTIIANPVRMQKDFTMRYNIHPTYLADAGLHRTPEPHAYTKTGDKMKLARPTCLSSPEFFAKRTKALDGMLKELPRYGMRFIWFGDEQSITGYGGNPVDFCFSEHCLKEMREFVKMRYGTLEKLNDAWETDFAAWDEVVPFTRQEVWAAGGKHVAGWADHLEFMDSRLTNSVAFSVNRIREVDPAVRFALSGTQRPSAYGGTDWWKQLNVMDAALNYGGGGQFDIHRSFCPGGGFMPWNWGYSRRGALAVADVWRTAFYGMRGLMGFQSTSQINQDWTFSRGLRDTLPHVRRLVEGTGMHFVNNLVAKHEVAILYSQASLRAAFIENRREEHDLLEEKVRLLLRNLGYAYDYVSYDELSTGAVAKRGYRVLLLADAVAMSDAEVAAVRAFVQAGGTVIAEGMPARRAANCRVRAAAPLADLFADGSRHTLFPEIDVRYNKAIEYPEKAANAPVVKMERERYENALVRAGASTTRVGIVNEETGRNMVNAEVFCKSDRAGNPLWGILAPKVDRVFDVRFKFPKKAFTYDLVSGRLYGAVDTLRLPLGQGTPYAFVQFPEAVGLEAPAVNGARLSFAFTCAVDGVVRVEVLRPDGTEAYAYSKNVLMTAGKGSYEIPFALSDPSGEWKVCVTSVFGSLRREAVVRR